MKFTIKTIKFQEMVAKAAKGASENKLLPITSMIAIELVENVLTLTTTDTSNTLEIIEDKIQGDDFYAVVGVDVFSRLIARTTAETITLTIKENSLEVKGNGVYNIPLPMDEEGVVVFPKYKFKKQGEPSIVHLTTVKNILNVNKAAIAKNLDTPCLCGYYVGDRVVTTDENVICFNDFKLLENDALISQEMMELLSLNTEEKINCYYSKGYFLFEAKDMRLYGAEHDDKELFPIEDINGYLDQDFESSCTIPKLLLGNVIDRLSLFIEPYDKNGAYFMFTKEGLKVTSKKSSSMELIAYQESSGFKPFVCCVDIPLFQAQINSIKEDMIQVWYGHDAALKLTSGKVTHIIALLEDEDMENSIGR